ncbi:hypothetical protein [Cohnella sp. GCM10012308]|uniref:hypothetical protein n=1 Tax=Cohnella sp. GCM10012308 TaxID=3317329 RepID=UPI00360C6600
MRKLGVIFIGCLPLTIPSVSASASASQSLSVESFHYEYEPTGLPVIRLLLKNGGGYTLEPKIAVTLKRAYSGRQNAYVYHKKALAKPDRAPVLRPGQLQTIRLRVDRPLAAGDYEADVDVKNQGMLMKRTYAFSIAEEDARLAKLALKNNRLQQFGDNGLRSRRFWTVGIGVVLISLVIAGAVRRNGGKKH